MPIPESQLVTWSHQGLTKQFKDTYGTIKNVLEEEQSPYADKCTFEVHLQGSYENDTNVYGDSDVDVVIFQDSAFFYSIEGLQPYEKAAFNSTLTGPPAYGYPDFKRDVTSLLMGRFGSGFVKPGKKAVFVKGNGSSRRDADVLICGEYQEYCRFSSAQNKEVYTGVKFFTSPDNQPIVNFPKHHSAMCTFKHQNTGQRFKPTVRVFKNMRNRMLEDGLLVEGVAPSYYIEGLLSNVPSSQFVSSYGQTFVNCIKWVNACDKSKLMCAHGLRPLLRYGVPDSWTQAHCDQFIEAITNFWNNWGK